ncbi:MAG: type II secretion system protein GspK [Desulfurivibrionaceae bacterium]
MSKIKPASQNNRGFALVVVILVMLIISFLASQLIMQVRTDMKISANHKERIVGRMLAEAGVNLALFRLLDKPAIDYEEKVGGPGLLGGYTYETVLSTGKIEYYAVSESGKIDLNRASIDLIRKFLAFQGLEPEEVDVVVDSLLDWRDNDDLHRVNGAEKDYYEGLDTPYIPRNGKIEDPAEFFMIRGTGPLRGKFDPYAVFTVDNNSSKININELSPEMLDFVAGGNKEFGEMIREEQELAPQGRLTKAKFEEITGDISLRNHLVDSVGVSKFYSIVAHGHAGGLSPENADAEEIEGEDQAGSVEPRPATRIRVLVNTARGFQYHAWRERFV